MRSSMSVLPQRRSSYGSMDATWMPIAHVPRCVQTIRFYKRTGRSAHSSWTTPKRRLLPSSLWFLGSCSSLSSAMPMYRLSFLLMRSCVPILFCTTSAWLVLLLLVEKEEEAVLLLVVAPSSTDWPVAGLLRVMLRYDGACRILLLPGLCFASRGSLYIFT